MAGDIFLVQHDGSLVELRESPYDAEVVLQELLATYPALLSGGDIDPKSPRRWLFITRELGIPGDDAGADRWSLDHLFLDQDAIPTLVEVKRSSDTRIRREVVGQMLDYAANAVVYLDPDRMRLHVESTCSTEGRDPEEAIADLTDGSMGMDEFWLRARTNLLAGRIRMLFVADIIPPELRRIIEFLNQQMTPAEVLGIEIPQFAGQGLQALVPKLIGQTAIAQQAKSSGTASARRRWNEVSFFEELSKDEGTKIADVARQLLRWATGNGLTIWWGQGAQSGSFFPIVETVAGSEWTFSVWTGGSFEIQFGMLASAHSRSRVHPFMDVGRRTELQARLNAIPRIQIADRSLDKRPNIGLTVLLDQTAMTQFLTTMDWLVTEIRRAAVEDSPAQVRG